MFRHKNSIHQITVWCFLKKPAETATETLETKTVTDEKSIEQEKQKNKMTQK